MNRTEFAERISSGLGGWFQQFCAQDLQDQIGEDAARVEIVRMISALRAFIPDTGIRPTNWPLQTKKRVDIAVLGRKQGAKGWYGAIELKWPGKSVDVEKTRHAIIEDAVRVSFCKTGNLCANFMVLGGTSEALQQLFDKSHPQAPEKEAQRIAFSNLFSREVTNPIKEIINSELNTLFPDFGDRVPQEAFNGWRRRFKTELIASVNASVGANIKGKVFVWQCRK
jgi:hypothetical protein